MSKNKKYSQSKKNFHNKLSSAGLINNKSGLLFHNALENKWDHPLVRGIILSIVFGIVLITYWPSLSAGALFMDDKFYLGSAELRNPSWTSVKTIFGEMFSPTIVKGYYQPITLLSIMLDFLDPAAAFSLKPFHRTTLLLHLVNVMLVVILLYFLFGNWSISSLMGLLYGLHPLNADAVLWIAERKAVLSTCFALCSLVFFVLYVRYKEQTNQRDWKRYGISLFMYLCAVLSKPTAIPVVILFLVLDYWPLRRFTRQTLLEKVPFFIVGGLSAVVTVISQTQMLNTGGVQVMNIFYLPFVMAYSLGFYFFKIIWPAGLVYDYPFPHPFSPANLEVVLCILGTVALITALIYSVPRTRAWLAGGLFFFIAILPALGIIRFTSTVVSNRFIYFPMVGLLLPLNWILNRFLTTAGKGLKKSSVSIILIGIVFSLTIGACAVVTRGYESKWKDTLTLLQYYLTQSPNDAKLHTRLGNEWIERNNLDSAIAEFTKAVHLNPRWAENHLNLGRALFTAGRFPEAQQAFTGALQQTPNDWRGHFLLGLTFLQQNNQEDSLKEFRRSAQLNPMNAEIHYNIANILLQQGKLIEAEKEYQETLLLEPQFWKAQKALETFKEKKP